MKRRQTTLLTVLLVLSIALAASLLADQINPPAGAEVNAPVLAAGHEPDPDRQMGWLTDPYVIADIAEQLSPTVVYIQVEWPRPEQAPTQPQDPFWDFFQDWFPFQLPGRQQPVRPMSQGTGFIIDPSGIVLTNQHVVGNVGDGQSVTVTVNTPGVSGEFEAVILGADHQLDLAVLQIQDLGEHDGQLPSARLGDSDTSRPGEWVIAIGNPYGQEFEHTVTVGVLSAKGREITIQDPEARRPRVYSNLMQTDAAINRGNSGGPLLNIQGEVIGINTAVHLGAQGIGFAIPINVAKEVLQELIETGEVYRPVPPRAWLGVYHQEITPEIANQLRLHDSRGVLILDVIDGSPADEAGFKAGDVIRRIDNEAVLNQQEFVEMIVASEPGDEIMVTVLRDGEAQLITVTLGDMPVEMR